MNEICVAGAAILDAAVRPVMPEVFQKGSAAADGIRLTTGGDAMNEATVLARLGHSPMLITKLGDDDAARLIEAHCAREGITLHAARDADMPTGVNVVLVDDRGERAFMTDPKGSLRHLPKADILRAMETQAFESVRIFCLASMFVAFDLGAEDMAEVFEQAKARGKLVCADTTKPKHGETARDIADALRRLDIFFANREEGAMLTGETQPERIAEALTDAGVKTAALKLGADGCLIRSGSRSLRVPALKDVRCVDTTGAGDTFAAAFLSAKLRGKDLDECARTANLAAGLCAEHLGATAYKMDVPRILKG